MTLASRARSRIRRALGITVPVLLVGAGMTALSALAPTAGALTDPQTMTATHLPTWQVNGVVWALAERDGIVYAGGTFSAIRPPGAAAGSQQQQRLNFAAFDAATGNPVNCPVSFTGTGASVRALDISPDGEMLYAAGNFAAANGHATSRVAAIELDTCTVDTGFRVGGVTGIVRGVAAGQTQVFLGGDFTSIDGQARRRFGAVDASTGARTAWQSNVFSGSTDGVGKAVQLTPDGTRVILAGNFRNMKGVTSHTLAVVDSATGALVRAYPLLPYSCRSGNDPRCEARSVTQNIDVDATGFYTAHQGTGGFDGRKAFDLPTLNQRWRDTCLGATQDIHEYNGMLYSGSHAHDCSSNNNGGMPQASDQQHLLAQSTQGSSAPPLLAWFPDTDGGIGEGLGPRTFVASGNNGTDYMWVGGEFTRVGGPTAPQTLQQGLTRFASGQSNDHSTPVTPDEFTASTAGQLPGRVQLRWRAAWDVDDIPLTYRIYRDGADVSPTPVGETSAVSSRYWSRPQVSFLDTGVPNGGHSYRVRAVDSAGNTSNLSATVSVNVIGSPAPPGPTNVQTTTDTYVNAGAPTSNFGTHQQLAARSTSQYDSYLRFSLPNAPAGTVLESAELRYRTADTDLASSAGSHPIVPITGAWDEDTVTFNTRPALDSTVLGTISGASQRNTDYTTALNTTWLSSHLGSTVNLALTAGGTESLWLWSSDGPADSGPYLHLVWEMP